jgi:lipopolysaccharide cholinephosphotransferase
MVPLNIQLPDGFLQEEERDGYFVTKEKKELWAVQLDLLNELDQVCRKNNLRYIIDFGTLLGAVRHKGFIPWDLDVDVSMPREDYEQLKKIADAEFKEPYFFQNFDTDKSIDLPITRLRRSDTTFFHLGSVMFRFKYNQGIFLDIFPHDHLPSNDPKEIASISEKSKQLLHRAETAARIPLTQVGNSYFILMLQYLYNRFRYGNSVKQFQHLDSFVRGFDYSGFLGSPIIGYTLCRPLQWYEDTVEMPFENLLLRAPKAYDELLKAFYGDYMTPVIVEYTVPYFNASRCYKDVLKDKAFCKELLRKICPSVSLIQVLESLWIALKIRFH